MKEECGMKKTLSLIMLTVIVISLAACGSSVKLTTENINNYLSIKASVSDCNVEKESGSILGIPYNTYNGDATAKIEVVNQSGAKFENVTITCKVYTFVDCIPGPVGYGWEFNNGNNQTGNNPHTDMNYKTITITLPYDGNWDSQENLTLKLYEDGIKYITAPYELDGCYVDIIDVTGTACK